MIETRERKRRDEPLEAPWTVSVAPMPGEDTCPELELLDRSLKKTRDEKPDADLENWKSKIAWPEPVKYSAPLFLTPMAMEQMRQWNAWMQFLELQRQPFCRLFWNLFNYDGDEDGDQEEGAEQAVTDQVDPRPDSDSVGAGTPNQLSAARRVSQR